MATNVEAKRVVYGTFSELWIEGDLFAEAISCKATLSADKTEVKLVRHMGHAYKVTGYTGKGSIKLHKVSSYFIKKLAPSIKQGKQILFTIVSKVADPDAFGAERIALKNCLFDSVDLVNWETGKLGEEDYSFTFEDYEPLDLIEAE